MEQATRFIGMDVYKDTIVVAVTATGDAGRIARHKLAAVDAVPEAVRAIAWKATPGCASVTAA